MDIKTTCNGRTFYILTGINKFEQTEFIQMNEETPHRPTPTLFLSRPAGGGETAVSMLFEGLPVEVFNWFISNIEKSWLNVASNNLLTEQM